MCDVDELTEKLKLFGNKYDNCKVVELTYNQLKERLKLLVAKYPKYNICINVSKSYNPTDTIGKARFDFPCQETNKLGYKEPFYCERYTKITVENEVKSLCKLKDKDLSQKVITVSHKGNTYYISGVYVDNKKEALVLLNGYYDGEGVDWSSLKGDIY